MRKSLLAAIALLAAAPLLAGLPKGWVGRDTCATCHEDVAKAFVAGPHGTAMAGRAPKNLPKPEGSTLDRSCESCHGPGEVHANDPSTKNIRSLKGASVADASAGCVSCHAAQKGGLAFRTHAHERAGIACLDCHVSGHAAPAAEPMLARDRGALCTGCHASQTAQFALPYAHRNGKDAVRVHVVPHGARRHDGSRQGGGGRAAALRRMPHREGGPAGVPAPADGGQRVHRVPHPARLAESVPAEPRLDHAAVPRVSHQHADVPRSFQASVPRLRELSRRGARFAT